MKLSICIPVYNFDVRELVFSLNEEIKRNRIDAEIVLIDDFSNEKFRNLTSELSDRVDKVVLLNGNVGRSKIRNLFLDYSTGEYLLFLDCDGKIAATYFLKNYLDFLNKNADIQLVFGGRIVGEEPENNRTLLRYRYAVEREIIPADRRQQNPYSTFQTNNFIVKRTVFEKVNFNINFPKYGYEDSLYAMNLKYEGIEIHHIENPVLNNDVEENSVYLKKVEDSVENLFLMLTHPDVSGKIDDIRLVKAFRKVNNWGLSKAILLLFRVMRKSVRNKLLEGNCNLRYLDFYKLGLLLELSKG